MQVITKRTKNRQKMPVITEKKRFRLLNIFTYTFMFHVISTFPHPISTTISKFIESVTKCLIWRLCLILRINTTASIQVYVGVIVSVCIFLPNYYTGGFALYHQRPNLSGQTF